MNDSTERQFKKLYITEESLNDMAVNLTIQESSGDILFDGDYDQAQQLLEALQEVLEENK